MNIYPISLAGALLEARGTGTLWWPEARLLCVSDLHLGKSERMARRGGSLLPPYEILDTLTRLSDEIEALNPGTVVALGDTFDDAAAAGALPREARDTLLRLGAGRQWIWIAGNHDPAPLDLTGESRETARLGPLTFRHIAQPGAAAGEVSGHYHPKARLAGRARPAFLADGARVILPAFGTYTGGLECRDPVLTGLMGPGAQALLTGPTALRVPLGK